jgi:alkyl hydroperoxide reductase subunit AhpC
VLFSHPKDFTTVCSTELGYMARIKHEFDRRNTKIIGLSVDALQDHGRWTSDIAKSQDIAPNYPIIGDPDLAVAKLYNMLPSNVSGNAARRTAADNQTVRNVFVVSPDKRIKLILVYPMTTGRNFDEVRHLCQACSGLRGAMSETRRGWDRQIAAHRCAYGTPRRRTTHPPALFLLPATHR